MQNSYAFFAQAIPLALAFRASFSLQRGALGRLTSPRRTKPGPNKTERR